MGVQTRDSVQTRANTLYGTFRSFSLVQACASSKKVCERMQTEFHFI
jgi:hypothetical protein